jgi:hypothetical protein
MDDDGENKPVWPTWAVDDDDASDKPVWPTWAVDDDDDDDDDLIVSPFGKRRGL